MTYREQISCIDLTLFDHESGQRINMNNSNFFFMFLTKGALRGAGILLLVYVSTLQCYLKLATKASPFTITG